MREGMNIMKNIIKKGLKINKSFEHLYRNTSLTVFISLFISILLLGARLMNENISQLVKYDFNRLIIFITLTCAISLVIIIVCFKLLLKTQIEILKNIEKLAKVIITNQFYIMETRIHKDKPHDKLMYFPKFYYREDKTTITITIKLDGSKFHDKYLELTKIFEPIYNAELVKKEVIKSHCIYTLFKIGDAKRLIVDTKVNKEALEASQAYKIPLMKGLEWDIIKIPGMLVMGCPGSGKTFFLYHILLEFLKRDYIVKILDAKMSDLSTLDSLLGKENVAYEKGQMIKQFRLAVEEMDRRYINMRESCNFGKNFTSYNYKPYFLIVDEFASLVSLLKLTKEHDEFKEVDDYLTRLILKGRQSGVFLVMSAQKMFEKYLGTDKRDALGVKVGFGNISNSGYKMLFDDEAKEKDLLPRYEVGQGYIYLQGESTSILEYYSPMFPDNYDFVEAFKELIGKKKEELEPQEPQKLKELEAV